jgi:hypothetical protein
MFEKIYLHTGLPKTGTSYLQSALDVLSRQDAWVRTSYPVLNGNENFTRIQSGNGEAIAFQLLEKHVPDFSKETILRLTQTLFDAADRSKPNLLISSEHFSDAAPARLAFLLELLGAQAQAVEVIVFVRPIDRLCHSRYHQQVKRHSQSAGYDESFFNGFSVRLASQVSLVGALSNRVHVFDYTRTGLLGVLLEFLGENPALEASFNNQVVNRSLTEQEMDLLRSINAVFKSDGLSTSISDRWIYACPEAISAEERANSERVFDVFNQVVSANTSRLGTATCREILGRLLPDVAPAALNVGASEVASAVVDEAPVVAYREDLLRMALEEIAKLMNFEQALSEHTQGLMPTCDAFDPVHYLLLNRDVLAAGVDPVQHFKSFGRKEGRFSAFSTLSVFFD